MKNKLLSIAILFVALFTAQAQDVPLSCGTVEPPNNLIISKAQASQLAADNTIRTIPLVWHIVHNPLLNPQDSAYAASKIAIYQNIMQKFMRKQNADTAQTLPQFRGVAADAHVEFCSKQVIFKRTTEVTFTTDDKIKYTPTGSPSVDGFKHCNIWLGRLSGSLGGYAYFPSATSVGAPYDGLVVLLSTTASDEQVAEIIIHELLHYLGVYHTFQGGSCTGSGDFCADTPPTDSPSGCQLNTIKCGGVVQVQNVMDYAHCATLLTIEQSARTVVTLIGLRNQLWNSGTCSGGGGNASPVVSITSPLNGARFTPPASVTINVTASDADGTITRVEFYSGATLLSTDISAPYSFNWTNVQNGNYVLTARATDNAGAIGTSAPVSITVGVGNTPPTCVMTSPANNAIIVLPNAVRLTANASDADGTITKVEFDHNNSLLVPDAIPPYDVYWYASVGTYQFKAICFDNSGASTTSATVSNVTVTNQTNTPPVVSITSPLNGASFTAPANITITATATDNVSISKVEFYNGNTLLGTDNTAPYSFTANGIAAGSYSLVARAYDNLNASTTSAAVNVTVTTARETIQQQWVENNKLFIQTNIRLYSVVIQPQP